MPKMPKWVRDMGMSRSSMIQGLLYMAFMATCVAVSLYFGLIPPEQMGLRLDTLPMGIVAGLICQLPLAALAVFVKVQISEKTIKTARMHFYAAPLDAPLAELFWSGVVASSIVAFLASLGLTPLFAGTLGAILGAGIHLTSHLGPMRMLVPEEGGWLGWFSFFLTMLMNRLAFVFSNNIVAPILGHALGTFLGLAIWRIKGVTDSIF